MKIKRLELRAFGPFSERVLDFSSERPGLHVVYGPNEAGKSSSLRALQALLFGFEKTGDNFLHPYEQFLVGGRLQAGDGRELTFFRRKKNKNSLFDQQDQPLDPAALTPFLLGLEKSTFATLYGIDHEGLVKGGQSILDQQGEVGQALFAAGTGVASLKAIVDDLELESDILFRPRGSSQDIALELARYKELQTQIKQLTLSSRDWQEHQQALDEAAKQLAEAHVQRDRLNREKHRLERLKRAFPYLGQRRTLLAKQAELGEVVILPCDFAEQRRELEQKAREIRNRRDAVVSRLHDLEEKNRGISVNQGVLDHAEAIEELHQGLGQYRKGKADSPEREGQRVACRSEAANLLRQIRPKGGLEEIEILRPSLAKRKTIQVLGARQEAITQAVRQARRQVLVTAKELENTGNVLRELTTVAEVGRLARAVAAGQQAGDLDREITVKETSLAAAHGESLMLLHRLGLWPGSPEQVAELALPLSETVQRFAEEFQVISEQQRQLQAERGQLLGELSLLGEQLQVLEFVAEVPTEEELGLCRRRRDQGWQLLRRQWLLEEDVATESLVYDSERPLPEAYERLVGVADQTADRLYREADRVQKHAALKARGAGIERRLNELSGKEVRVEADWAESCRRWRELWTPCGIDPLPPREMYVWLSGFDKVRFHVLEAAKVAGELSEQEVRRRGLRDILLVELAACGGSQNFPGEELSLLLHFAEALVQRVQGEVARRERLEDKRRDLVKAMEIAGRDQDAAEEELRQWQERWEEAVAPLGLGGQTLPAEALDFLDTLQRCFDKVQEADDFRKRIEGIGRDAREFEEKILLLAQRIAPELAGLEAAQVVSQLFGRLARASQEQALLHQNAVEIEGLAMSCFEFGIELADCEEQLAVLHRLARCTKAERLNEVERRSSEYLKLKDKLAEVEANLVRIAEGVALADLETQAYGLDPDELPFRIEAIITELEGRVDPEIRHLSETIGREKNELARMDGSGKAAELAENAQQILARMRRLSERYIRIKLATRFLREEIERYRAENQDPVLTIASRYFRDLTLGSLVGLRTDSDEQGLPVLVGVRRNGDWLQVGGMSSGTRDQLYLSLRLATIEWRLQSSEPMPFIVDDILINFDDQRTQATIKALADLAEKTQVILFTHHGQVFESVQALQGRYSVFAHQL